MKIVMNEMDADLFLKLYKSVEWDGPGMFKMLRQKIALADWESEFYGV